MADVYCVEAKGLQIQLSKLYDYIQTGVDLPDAIDTLSVDATTPTRKRICAHSDSVSKYTPTADFVGTIKERHVVVEDGKITHKTTSQAQADAPGWDDITEDDDFRTKAVEYITFNGPDHLIMRHSALRAEMFDVLCQLTTIAHKGYVQGIIVDEDGLRAVRYDAGGEKVPVKITLDPDTETHESADEDGPEATTSRSGPDSQTAADGDSTSVGSAPVMWSSYSS